MDCFLRLVKHTRLIDYQNVPPVHLQLTIFSSTSAKTSPPPSHKPVFGIFYGLFWNKATELVMLISKQRKDGSGSLTVDIHAWAGRLAMDAVGVAAFGTNFGLLADGQN